MVVYHTRDIIPNIYNKRNNNYHKCQAFLAVNQYLKYNWCVYAVYYRRDIIYNI